MQVSGVFYSCVCHFVALDGQRVFCLILLSGKVICRKFLRAANNSNEKDFLGPTSP